jgi:hypothetical protein
MHHLIKLLQLLMIKVLGPFMSEETEFQESHSVLAERSFDL